MLWGGARPHSLIAWELGDQELAAEIIAIAPGEITRNFVRAAAQSGARFGVLWGRLWDARSGALHLIARDELALRTALAHCCERAQTIGATATGAALFLKDEGLRGRCAELLAELSTTVGTA